MMNFSRLRRPSTAYALWTLALCLRFWGSRAVSAQVASTRNATQQLVFAGLSTVAGRDQVEAVKSDTAEDLYLLLNQGDGVRIVKTNRSANNILARAQLGAAGDSGVGLALDPAGNVYVAGTTSSNSFAATAGAAFGTCT